MFYCYIPPTTVVLEKQAGARTLTNSDDIILIHIILRGLHVTQLKTTY